MLTRQTCEKLASCSQLQVCEVSESWTMLTLLDLSRWAHTFEDNGPPILLLFVTSAGERGTDCGHSYEGRGWQWRHRFSIRQRELWPHDVIVPAAGSCETRTSWCLHARTRPPIASKKKNSTTSGVHYAHTHARTHRHARLRTGRSRLHRVILQQLVQSCVAFDLKLLLLL